LRYLYLLFDLQSVASWFVRHAPQVRGFGGVGGASSLVNKLENVNLLARTQLCKIMLRHGSDKSHFHDYTVVYSALFKAISDAPLRIFELGLGSNNPEVPSNMGNTGIPGASLRGWREYFPQALVYGADIDRGILFQESRIKTFHCDQLDPAAIRGLWTHPEMREGADIIIEDGLHTVEGNISFLEGSLDHLVPGGIYAVEDIDSDDIERWYGLLEGVYSKRYPDFDFAFAVLPTDSGLLDNNLLVIRRRAN
jgi:hypothetical protein